MPLISVLMPVYNAQPYLAKAIESILNQSLRDFEFLILDDGSTDRSPKILRAYAAQDSRIRLTSRVNGGYVSALNALLAVAEGVLIARMDADDVALPDRFAQQAEFLQQQPQVVCLGGAFDLIDAQDRRITTLLVPLEDAEIQRLALSGHTPINHPSAMIRHSALLQVGGYDEALSPAEDLDLWLKLGEIGQLANLSATVLQYRQHSGSVSECRQLEQTAKRRIACQQAWSRRGVVGQFEATNAWRPGKDRDSQHQFTMQYGWWAFNSNERQTAVIYALKAIRLWPSHIAGWKLLIYGLLKPMSQAD